MGGRDILHLHDNKRHHNELQLKQSSHKYDSSKYVSSDKLRSS